MLAFFSSLPISVLCILDNEANKFHNSSNQLYDAALLTTYIDSEINHKRYFIKISFISKGVDFIDLPSNFRDNSIISSIPTYFQITETPIICYKYTKKGKRKVQGMPNLFDISFLI